MSHFLFAVEVPPVPEHSFGMSQAAEWTKFCNDAKSKLPTGICNNQPASNVWLIPVENAVPVLVALSTLVDLYNLSYTVSFITGDVKNLSK